MAENKGNSRIKYTAFEFFDFFRKNINLFAEKFNFSKYAN